MRYLLASASPRRKFLLSHLLSSFEVAVSNFEEIDAGRPRAVALLNAVGKARAVQFNGVIIAADTLVYANKKIYGKPKDAKDAIRILEELSGKWLSVYTGICVRLGEEELVECEVTRIKFGVLRREEIQDYVATGSPMDKAGAFGTEDKSAAFIEKISGDYFNVLGLPIYRLKKMLEKIDKN
ncbi:MAG: septum formation protein Maf [Nanoarchaeota archaeon]|nr:septum formation protein Maf [Nanoarchaeota archaeon]